MSNFKRLTTAQRKIFLSVAEGWGDVFEVYSSYYFLIEAGVVEPADREQIEEHYAGVRRELDRLTGAMRDAIDEAAWKQVEDLAGDAHYAQQVLEERDNSDRNKWWVLSSRGRELADKYIALRDAQIAAEAISPPTV